MPNFTQLPSGVPEEFVATGFLAEEDENATFSPTGDDEDGIPEDEDLD